MGKKINKSTRNILALPNEAFWPLLQETESETLLQTALLKAFKQAKTIQPQFKWAYIRKMKHKDRLKKVEEFFQNLPHEELVLHEKAKYLKKSLAIGVNEVSKKLEKEQLACCLIHGQAKPKMIIKHLIQIAKCRRIPILILNDLKETLKESLGFTSLAVGFLKEVINDENHEFFDLCSMVVNLSKDLDDDSSQTTDIKIKAVSLDISTNNENEDFNLTPLYLYRTSSNYRIFHPPEKFDSGKVDETLDNRNSVPPENHNSDDIAECPTPNKKPKIFVEANILRVQSNPNKFRKKKKKNSNKKS